MLPNTAEAIKVKEPSISGGRMKANTTMPTTNTASTNATMASLDVTITTYESLKKS